MEKKFNYLYKITNNINNKFYYGIHSTNNLNDNYMGSGKRLHEAYNKYGLENFTKDIICFKSTRQEISDLEQKIVNENLVKNTNCYNLCLGGGNPPFIRKGYHHTDSFRQHISKVLHKNDDELKLKRRIMSKNGILKSIPIDEINEFIKEGWTFDRRNSKYQHTKDEYNELRRKSKEKNNKIKEEKSRKYQTSKAIKRKDIRKLINENLQIININKWGWINQLSKLIPSYSKQEIINVLKIDYQDVLSNAKMNITHTHTKQIWVHNEIISKRIKIEELEEYLALGYNTGRGKINKE